MLRHSSGRGRSRAHRCSTFETLNAVRDVLLLANNPPFFVLFNGMHLAARKSGEEVKAITRSSFALAACPVHLCQRSSYAEAPADKDSRHKS
jgi:hypothetical protein